MKQYAESFTVSKVFDSDMVLQRNERIRIWGWAEPEQNGRLVCASFMGLRGEAEIVDGEWLIELDGTLGESSRPGESLVVWGADGFEVVFEDVLVGDVYMIIGQSNVRYNVEAIINGAPEGYPGRDCVITDDELIRLNLSSIHDADGNDIYPVRGTTELCRDVRNLRGWKKPSEGALEFSALGFFTAQILISRLGCDIPIGIIEIDADGQALNAFMPNELADELHTDELIDGVYKGMWHVGPEPSRYVYNHFIHPFQKASICALIWYQGESDFNDVNAPVFAKNYTALITELRRRFDMKEHRTFPVFMVEIPSCYPPYEGWPEGELWAYIDMARIRCEMGKIPNMLDECYLAASSDLWLDKRYWNSLHPYCKYPQAERIAAMILARRFAVGDLEHAAGPQMTGVTYSENKASIAYRYVAEGLTSTGSSDIRGFEVKLSDGWHEPEDVREHGDVNGDGICDTIELSAGEEILGVRYNCKTDNFFPDKVNLCSSEGIPAIAFIDEKQ